VASALLTAIFRAKAHQPVGPGGRCSRALTSLAFGRTIGSTGAPLCFVLDFLDRSPNSRSWGRGLRALGRVFATSRTLDTRRSSNVLLGSRIAPQRRAALLTPDVPSSAAPQLPAGPADIRRILLEPGGLGWLHPWSPPAPRSASKPTVLNSGAAVATIVVDVVVVVQQRPDRPGRSPRIGAFFGGPTTGTRTDC
jgi:hypothetical protein